MNIQYIKLSENVGSGKARQIGIDSTTGNFITFLDSDDSFMNEFSLYLLYDEILKSKSDFVSGDFIREYAPETIANCPLSQLRLGKVQKNQTWVFSRLFSRKFLTLNNIQFNDMRYNEDVCFMQLCFAQSENHKHINKTIYVQHFNKDSITRSDNSEFKQGVKGIVNFVKALSYAHLKKRELGVINTEKSKQQMCDGLAVSYWYFIQSYYENTTDECEEYLKALQELYNLITYDFKDIIKSNLLKESYFISINSMDDVSGRYIPSVGFFDLLQDLEDNKNIVKIDDNCKYQFG